MEAMLVTTLVGKEVAVRSVSLVASALCTTAQGVLALVHHDDQFVELFAASLHANISESGAICFCVQAGALWRAVGQPIMAVSTAVSKMVRNIVN